MAPCLEVDKVNLKGSVVEVPVTSREDIPTIDEKQLVIEFYSRFKSFRDSRKSLLILWSKRLYEVRRSPDAEAGGNRKRKL